MIFKISVTRLKRRGNASAPTQREEESCGIVTAKSSEDALGKLARHWDPVALGGYKSALDEASETLGRSFTDYNQIPSAMILGEDGRGLEVIARMIHLNTRNWQGPWVVIHCAELGSDGERDLLGQEGAPGCLEMAQGGTVLFVGIQDLEESLQGRVLQVIRNQDAGSKTRWMATARKDIRERVQDGRFHEGLFQVFSQFVFEAPAMTSRVVAVVPGQSEGLREGNRLRLVEGGGNPRGAESLPSLDAEKSYTDIKRTWSDSFEKKYLLSLLEHHGGNVSAAARQAKLDRSNFLRLLRRHGIKANEFRRMAA